MVRYVGIDLHKHLLVACFLDEQGNVLQQVKIEAVTHASVEGFCRSRLRAEDQVALEVTTNSWAVARLIQPHVARVVVSNPMATKAIAQAKVKTDKVDSYVLAQLLRLDFLPSVWAPDEELSRLRELTARRARLTQDRTKLVNRIRSCLAMRLLHCPESLLEAKGRAWLAAAQLDEEARWLVDSDLRLLDTLQVEIDALDKLLAQRMYQDQRVTLLMTLPGVSVQVALALVAAIGDIGRFSGPEKLASYLGLVPSTRQSASKCYHGRITKAGQVDARWALVQAARCARIDLGPLGYFFNKVARRKSFNVAVVAVARKLAMLAWHLLTTQRPYRYAKPQSVAAKLSKLRVLGSGQKRKTGVPKGTNARTLHAAETRNRKRTPGLTEVLAKEGLPAPTEPAPGEQRILRKTQTEQHYEAIQRASTRPRRRQAAAPVATDNPFEQFNNS